MRNTSARGANANGRGRCPTFIVLIRAISNDLPLDEQRAVVRHVERCPACQAEIGKIECVQGAAEYAADKSPAATQLASAFQSDEAPAQPSIRRRFNTSDVRWLPLAAAALLVAMALAGTILRYMDVVHADAILASVAQREHDSLSINELILCGVPSKGQGGASTERGYARLDDAAARRMAVTLLGDYGFDASRPFRAAPTQKWMAGLPNRRDQVTRRNGELIVRITGHGPLSEIEFAVDETQSVIVRQRWVFDGVGRFECTRPAPVDHAPR